MSSRKIIVEIKQSTAKRRQEEEEEETVNDSNIEEQWMNRIE